MTGSQVTEDVVDWVAELLGQRIGLRAEPTVRGRLRRCIRDEATDHGLDLEAYLHTIAARGSAFESLLDRVTVQETGFFRHPEHFRVLVSDVLPTLQPPVRFWSTGCANGQEAFSLAIVLEEQGMDGWVVATDLSTKALRRTAAGRYTGRELSGLSPERAARYLTRSGHGWEVTGSLRNRVVVLRHNLIDPFPDEVRSCQVVFCRNVLIYISHRHSRLFLQRVADTVAPAALFLGSAEAIWPVSDRFEVVRIGDTFVHRPKPAATVHSGPTGPGPVNTGSGRGAPGPVTARGARLAAGTPAPAAQPAPPAQPAQPAPPVALAERL